MVLVQEVDTILSFLQHCPEQVVAISDLYEDLVKEKESWVREVASEDRHQNIQLYWGSEDRWKVMLEEVRPNVVFIATNWCQPRANGHKEYENGSTCHG